MENAPYEITYLEHDVVNLKIPHICVDQYPIWRVEGESDFALHARVSKYAQELIARHDTGEPYAIGYRECKDGKIRLVIRKVIDGVTYQRAIGFDEDFKQVG